MQFILKLLGFTSSKKYCMCFLNTTLLLTHFFIRWAKYYTHAYLYT